jgi:hypothetical protein
VNPDRRSTWSRALGSALRISTLGWDLAVPVVGGAVLGRMLHARYGTGHGLTAALLVLGALVGAYSVARQLRFGLRRDAAMTRRALRQDGVK